MFLLPNGRQRTVRFGTGSNYVSNPRKTARARAAYIARHRVNENHNDPLTPGALSRWLLWGESRSLARNTAAFRRRFRLQWVCVEPRPLVQAGPQGDSLLACGTRQRRRSSRLERARRREAHWTVVAPLSPV